MESFESRRPEFYEALGRTIQVLRTDQSLDRKELADRAGISYSYLAAIENGKKPPSSKVLFAIADALGLRSHELLASVENRFSRHYAFAPAARPRFAPPSRRREWFHGSDQEAMLEAQASPAPYAAPPPAAASSGAIPYSPAGFLMELDRVSRGLSDEDRDLVLGLARRLAGDEG